MNGIEINKDTFENLQVEDKLNALFDVAVATHKSQQEQLEKFDKRFKILEKRKIKDTSLGAGSGLMGGFLAVALKKIFLG